MRISGSSVGRIAEIFSLSARALPGGFYWVCCCVENVQEMEMLRLLWLRILMTGLKLVICVSRFCLINFDGAVNCVLDNLALRLLLLYLCLRLEVCKEWVHLQS